MPFNDLDDYYRHIKSIVTIRAVTNNQHSVTKIIPNAKTQGFIRTRNDHPLKFRDGSVLRFNEELRIVNREIERVEYSYKYTGKYEGVDYYFRYDKDPNKVSHPDHALCHLHANQEEPRFITHETSFEEVFQFILACFPVDA